MKPIGEIALANGVSREWSGKIAVSVDDDGVVILEIEKHHTVSLRLPPTLARNMGDLLLKAAGPKTPKLKIV
ncbi:hypothetical protein [Hyphomicrobium sp.]|uniref:hypothetical protein n=1 Tax=Hyphomicrobium sp. TaxID=82 RepID=UPI001DF807DC|nr:hypothetical protein [Hyphomicrobium sp.]MBY0561533.1 hypothetical protein [Hyphomicrobium sp.]